MTSLPDKDKQENAPSQTPVPFAAFTRFIDERISNMLQSMIGLPSSLQDMHTWQTRMEAGKDQHIGEGLDRAHRRELVGELEKPSLSSNNNTEEPSYMHALTSVLSELDRTVDGIQKLHAQMSASFDSAIPHDGIEKCSAAETLERLRNYLDESPYSPIQLENDLSLRGSPQFWRSAFSDLVEITQTGEDYANIFRNPFSHMPGSRPEEWKGMLLWNFSINHRRNYLQRHLSTSIPWYLASIPQVAAGREEITQPAQDNNVTNQKYREPHDEALHPESLAGELIRLLTFAGDWRSFDDDFDAKHLGRRRSIEDVFRKHRYESLRSVSVDDKKQPSPSNNSDSRLSDQEQSSVLSQMTVVLGRPKADGNWEMLVQEIRSSDGTMKSEDRSQEMEKLSTERQRTIVAKESQAEPQMEPQKADTPPRAKKGGWFWQ